MPKSEEWITVQQAAELSGYSEQYLRRIIRNHKIKAQKFGVIWQVSKLSLLIYIDQAKKTDKRWGPKEFDTLE